jgi:opacity protein-like surface antigen
MSLKAIVVALCVTATMPVFSQVVPSATQSGLSLRVGAGFSDYSGDLNNGQLIGGALWVDFTPPHLPEILHGLGIEGEARGVRANRSSPTAGGAFQQATAGGGPTYTWRRYRNFRPYAKFLVNLAGQDFNIGDKEFHHESQIAYAPGGGIDYRITRNLWARADYEYQIWPDAYNTPHWTLDPEGITVGLAWDFRSSRRH